MAKVTLVVVLLALSACADQGAIPEKKEAASSAQASPAPALPPPVSKGAPASPAFVPDVSSPAGGAEMTWTAPAGWVEVEPSSSMRRAQYRVPGPGGDAELAVVYFGPGQGGDAMSNAKRWAGQFKRPDGSPATETTKTMRAGDRSVLLVEVAGTYDGGMTMTAAPSTPKPGYALLGAIVEGPDANWFFKLTGPEATIAAQRDPFLTLLQSLR